MKYKKRLMRVIGFIYLIGFVYLSVKHFQLKEVSQLIFSFFTNPVMLFVTFVLYGMSFVLRAFSWKLYLQNKVPLQTCLNGLWYSLFINHVAPIKVGDLIRIGFLKAKVHDLELDEITHSVVVMRVFDLLTVLLFSAIGLIVITKSLALELPIAWVGILLLFSILLLFMVKKYKPVIVMKHIRIFIDALSNRYGIILILAIVLSWILEASVVYFVTRLIDQRLLVSQSIWVNSMTIGGQVFQFLPGGIATYETTMAFTLTRLQFSWQEAYQIALVSHIFKFIFSYIMGAYVLIKDPISLEQLRNWLPKKRWKTN
jgi:uncharacterized membrane protein YbhN (UPF0104 family)